MLLDRGINMDVAPDSGGENDRPPLA